MAPPAATLPQPTDEAVFFQKAAAKTNGSVANDSYDVLEDYNGNYRFAPIEEAQVSRAMIKRCV